MGNACGDRIAIGNGNQFLRFGSLKSLRRRPGYPGRCRFTFTPLGHSCRNVLIRVLGAAAGGGFPQWNCNCRNCAGVRDGSVTATPRTQSSIAVSTDGDRWVLCNASPDLHRQIAANPPLQPRTGIRDTPIAAVVLVDGQIDHTTGLLLLREHRQRLDVWTTEAVRTDLTSGLPLLSVLQHYCGVEWHPIGIDGKPFQIPALPGIEISALPVEGKPGPYSPHRQNPRIGDNIALSIRDTQSGRRALYAPGLAAISESVNVALHASQCVLVDGTFWRDDEMIAAGVSSKRASELGHLPQSGASGMIETLVKLPPTARRILIHINNTNPILDEQSAERAALTDAGIEVAFDGLEIRL
jgi:pyrroloquinoline quinone biosynthesis protein B